jgi:hypothetical protein
MTTPIVTEIRRRLEPVVHDDFAASLPAPPADHRPGQPPAERRATA